MSIIKFARKLCINRQSSDASGHSHHHSFRVYDTATTLQKIEGGHLLVVQLAALLHDVNDKKLLATGVKPIDLVAFLTSHELDSTTTDHVAKVIDNISFKGAKVGQTVPDIETAIVMDADRLDALGAIGIARTFAYGGSVGHDIYDPDEKPVMHDSEEGYFANTHCSINHFHEKLLLLKDRMNTETGKCIAEARHNYMVKFLEHFHDEWNGRL